MSDKKNAKLPFESDDPAEQRLWAALKELPQESPSANLRRDFYRELERASSRTWTGRLRDWLGFSGNAGWVTAAACLLLGIGMGQLDGVSGPGEPGRLAVLEENVATLNRQLILDRLEDTTAGKRLRGVIDASYYVEDDAEIARALLMRATEDRVQSVRSAAIDALGPTLGTDTVGIELMNLLENAGSPLVQFALVDLVLRHGSEVQLQQLLQLAEQDRLHPDLIRHVKNSLGSESV